MNNNTALINTLKLNQLNNLSLSVNSSIIHDTYNLSAHISNEIYFKGNRAPTSDNTAIGCI